MIFMGVDTCIGVHYTIIGAIKWRRVTVVQRMLHSSEQVVNTTFGAAASGKVFTAFSVC